MPSPTNQKEKAKLEILEKCFSKQCLLYTSIYLLTHNFNWKKYDKTEGFWGGAWISVLQGQREKLECSSYNLIYILPCLWKVKQTRRPRKKKDKLFPPKSFKCVAQIITVWYTVYLNQHNILVDPFLFSCFSFPMFSGALLLSILVLIQNRQIYYLTGTCVVNLRTRWSTERTKADLWFLSAKLQHSPLETEIDNSNFNCQGYNMMYRVLTCICGAT